ncbi:alpha/beta fold hydrolase [Saccharothrix coeruleofusca]|uniref:alpha/beta fold hydrolase n=1 Tax=Saccharothrix coeruleofusca TaxID=33919 RepID=UPI00166F6553|nr:alpha/beta hydrolase [Saccharothrix coeruleofusca]MBP2339572.1 pimeloyl-ACP methyl ester carboxylesterase [Saccharothrix coeruleofusca]
MTWHRHGTGSPVTLVGHGLGATPGEARLPTSGVPGTRVVVTLPGHGDEPDPEPDYWTYPRIAADLRAAAAGTGATRAVGVSLTSGALLSLLADQPDAFERVVLLLPAVLDTPRPALPREEAITAVGGPPEYQAQRRAAFARLDHALARLPGQTAVPDRALLARVRAPVLVIGATEDPLHPEEVAKEVAAAFPRGRLELVPSWLAHRAPVRRWLTDFLAG